MGRKIPGKKHRGVKDPYEQHAKRRDLIKNKINSAPVNPDEQPAPKSMLTLLKRKDGGDISKKVKKANRQLVKRDALKKKLNDVSIVSRSFNPLSKLQKNKGEHKKTFNMRINEALKSLKRGNNVSYKDIEEVVPEKKQNNVDPNVKPEYIQKKGRKKRKHGDEPQLSKNQKKSLKEKTKKEKVIEKKEFEQKCMVKTDIVKFGEIVHEPPTLNVKPRKAEGYETVSRPARKDLLLNSLFENHNQENVNINQSKLFNMKLNQKRIQEPIDLKGKRKGLPSDIRKKLEESQQEAIEAYKLLKLQKHKNPNS